MRESLKLIVVVVVAAATLAGCAASRAFNRGESLARAGDWDAAVAYFQRAAQAKPHNAEYKIALERAMTTASRLHLDQAKEFEKQGNLDAALREYRKASQFDPSNRQAAAKVTDLDRTIRLQIEAARPRPAIEQMRERARAASAPPVLNPASREPIPRISFVNSKLSDIINFIGTATGINITYDREASQTVDRAYTIDLRDVTIDQALNQILTANQLFYKVQNERTIIIVQDTPQKRAAYEEQVIRTFFISHADVAELSQLISLVIRTPSIAVQPLVAINKLANSITVRATVAVADVIEEIIRRNDKPRAEIIVDVEILEVNRNRAKQLGLNLTQYALGTVFSPEVAPPNTPVSPDSPPTPPPFNLNTISQGVSTADFFGLVPSAFVNFLETDSQTKLMAKPQLRGQEGHKLTLNLGEEIPVPSTSFTPIAGGGASVNPLTSFNLKPVGLNIEMTPRVTYEGDIILELLVESSTLGQSINVAGTLLPTFGSRKATAWLRLRDGESNLLAGLLREDERRSLRGFPGLIRLPFIRSLFSGSDDQINTTDIVMLLTPRIIRTHELTERDLRPIYIGTQSNLGLTGAPQLIAAPPGTEQPPAGTTPPAGTSPPVGGTVAPGAQPGVPVGSAVSAPAGVPTGSPLGAQPGVPGSATGAPRPAGTASVPGVVAPPAPAPAPPPPVPQATAPAAAPSATQAAPMAAPDTAGAGAQITVTAPGTQFNVGSGPYTVPLSISGASRVSTITLTLTFNAAALRVISVQEGSFMKQGGFTPTFSRQVDPAAGRVDITITRGPDTVGASGTGLLAAVLFEAVAPGTATLSPSGVATTATGAPLPLQFTPVMITVR